MRTTMRFVQNKFAEYYQERSPDIQPPHSLKDREFGFFQFTEDTMFRHKGFKSSEEFRSFLKTSSPSDAYYSGAYYERPQEKMERKGWLGADLIFDIDADHLTTPCQKEHDLWICSSCGAIITGTPNAPMKCTCGKNRFKELVWPCEICLETAKVETSKLVDVLINDFGFSQENLTVAFSGHRGYHVHVESEKVRTLDSIARKEVVDYITGTGLEPKFHGLVEEDREGAAVLAGPDLDDPGWKGRIARGTWDLISKATIDDLNRMGISKSVGDKIQLYREQLLESYKVSARTRGKGPWAITKGLGMINWSKIANYGVKQQAVNIDTVVTTDIHRLIRLTDTLHGKTGLKKMDVPIDRLEQYDPLKEAVVFNEENVVVFVKGAPEFRLGENKYGPYTKEKVEVPTAVAILLLCKRVAEMEK